MRLKSRIKRLLAAVDMLDSDVWGARCEVRVVSPWRSWSSLMSEDVVSWATDCSQGRSVRVCECVLEIDGRVRG
jgi:hypothetical protein